MKRAFFPTALVILTIVFFAFPAQGIDKTNFNVNLIYGRYQGQVTSASSTNTLESSTTNINATQPNVGIDFNLKFPLANMPDNYYWGFGYCYNLPVDGLAISYLHLDAIGNNADFYGGVGINYSFWNRDINGELGLQLVAGKPINENLKLGVRYSLTNGKNSSNGYDNSYRIYQIALEGRFEFN